MHLKTKPSGGARPFFNVWERESEGQSDLRGVFLGSFFVRTKNEHSRKAAVEFFHWLNQDLCIMSPELPLSPHTASILRSIGSDSIDFFEP